MRRVEGGVSTDGGTGQDRGSTTPTQNIHFEHTENGLLAPPVPLSVAVVIGGVIVTSVVLAYSAYAYRVFRGKTPDNGWEG